MNGMTNGDQQAHKWPEISGRPRICSARIDSDRGELPCTGWANHTGGHTFEATSQPQDAARDTEAKDDLR